MSDDFSKFTAPRADEELHQGLEVPVTFSIDPEDRMPIPGPAAGEDRPPPLLVDTFVCMEDKRSFVIRNSDGSVWMSFEPRDVQRLPNGKYFVKLEQVSGFDERSGQITGFQVRHGDGQIIAVAEVWPVRPACVHYARVQQDISADRTKRWLSRSCMAQRSETGEYYSVGDSAVFACTLREPRHFESEQAMDDIDEREMKKTLDRIKAGSFDVDAELAKEDQSGTLGVLGSNPKG